jgi:glycosyltransferase involved in cell wall biosynthesis
MREMRFLLLNQYYLPDMAPTGKYLHDLAQVLVQSGHRVKVMCSRRSYDGAMSYPAYEIMDGVEVVRLPATAFGRRGFVGKMSDYTSYYGALFAALMFDRERPDLILSLTTPPYVGLLGKLAAKRHGCRHAHWIMDLYPDVMFAHGMARKGGMLFHVLRRLTRLQLKGAECVLTLGPRMAESVAEYAERGPRDNEAKTTGPRDYKTTGRRDDGTTGRRDDETTDRESSTLNPQPSTLQWVPLWSDPEMRPWPENEPNPLRAERGWSANETVFLYSGNMGLGHRFTEFLAAAKQLGASGPRWVFSGGGKRRAEIESGAKAIPKARIEFLDYVPHSQLRAHLCAADVHLASLDSAWQGLMVPSKLQGSFAVGRPVIYVGGRNCETSVWIEESGGGWVVDENDLDGLALAIKQAMDPGERRKRAKAALDFARTHFHISTNCTRIVQLLEKDGGSNRETRRARKEAEALKR